MKRLLAILLQLAAELERVPSLPSSVIPPLELCLLRIITNWPQVCKLKTCLLTIPGGKVNIDNKEAFITLHTIKKQATTVNVIEVARHTSFFLCLVAVTIINIIII
jgi:hypothetical protein